MRVQEKQIEGFVLFCFPQVTVQLDLFMYNLQQTCELLKP